MEDLRVEGMNERADPELILGALNGDEISVRILIQKYNRRLYRVARSVVGDDAEAEDVLQDAYVRAFSALDGYRGEASLATKPAAVLTFAASCSWAKANLVVRSMATNRWSLPSSVRTSAMSMWK